MPIIRNVTSRELKELYSYMRKDFPANERLPYFILRNSVIYGRLKACYLQENNGTICGYAICVLPPDNDYFHIQYIAILPEHRSKGYGTLFLEMLSKRFHGRKIILEVEDPALANNEDDRQMREKRIAFYQRAGLRMVDNMKFVLFGVRMLCMTNDPRPISHPQKLWMSCYFIAMGSKWMLRFVDTALEDPNSDTGYASQIPLGNYKHFKGGEYRVLHLACHSETLETLVIYQKLYGDFSIWARPAAMWNEMIEYKGQVIRRFTYMDSEG